MHGLEEEYSGKINFSYLDIDDPATDPIKQSLGYRVQPHIFLLDNQGHIIQQWLGPVSKEELVDAFEQVLSQ